MKTIIKNCNIVTETQILTAVNLLISDGRIAYIGREDFPADKMIDGQDGYLMAGFIDLHCHGGSGLDFMDALPEEMKSIAAFHLSHGTTTLYATTMTDSLQNIETALDHYNSLFQSGNTLTLNGVHLEGPWLSKEQCGAQQISDIGDPDVKQVRALLEKYPFIKRITLAPEQDDSFAVGEYCSQHSVAVSAGHTNADFDTIINAHKKGYQTLTHFYSGMSSVVRKNAYRTAGVVEAGYYLDDMTVEVISDGRHLPDSLLKLIYKIKGADQICLITDGTRGCGLADGTHFKLGSLANGADCIIDNGVAFLPDKSSFAGSVATFDRLIRTMLRCGADLISVSKMASGTPASVMGLKDRGRIEIGLRADLVLLDKNYNIKNVLLKGEPVK